MITESYYWKKPLLSGATIIDKYMALEDITDAQFARIEREIFVGSYAIRKLFEAVGKVSPETRNASAKLKWFPKKREQPIVDWYNRSEFWELYDLGDGNFEARDLLYTAHRLVHSFIFVLSGSDDGDGVFFTSDRDKEFRINFIETAEITRLFRVVGNDYPSDLRVWRDRKTGEMRWHVPPSEPK